MNSTKGNKTASPADKTNDAVYEATDPIMEWLQLIGFLLVKRQKIFQIYQLIGSSTSTQSNQTCAVANHEQLILLQILLSVLEDVYCSPDIVSAYETDERRYFDQLVLLLADKVCMVIGSEGRFLDAVLAAESSGNNRHNSNSSSDNIRTNSDNSSGRGAVSSSENLSDIDASIARIDHNITQGLNVDFLILALQVIGTSLAVLSDTATAAITTTITTITTTTTRSSDGVNQLKATIVHSTQLIQRTSALIANYHVGARSRIDPLYGKNTSRICSDGETAVKDIVKSTLQLLGNVVYNCKDAQLLLKDCGGLATVLSHCATDFVNPLAREWALFCVRNACADCLPNQEFIESLRPQSVSIQDEDMKSKGIEVEMTGTGKFKFVQKTSHHSVDSGVGGVLGSAINSVTHNSSSSEMAGSGSEMHTTVGSGSSNSGNSNDENNCDIEHDSDSDSDNRHHRRTANTTTSVITQAQEALQSDSKVAQGKGERKAREELEE